MYYLFIYNEARATTIGREVGRPRVAAMGAAVRRRRGKREEEKGNKMTGGPRGKIVYLHLYSAENDYYNCYDVLQTKSSIHGVLEPILNFVVCYTQNYIFTALATKVTSVTAVGR